MKAMLIVLVLLAGTAAQADGSSPSGGDELAQNLFAPELVLKYRQEIGLDSTQSRQLKSLIQTAQSKFLDLQWDMQAETGKLIFLLKARPVDATLALAQVDRVLNLENDVKKAQLGLLINIKNLLTGRQQDQLLELRGKGP